GTPTTDQYNMYLPRLNDIINYYQTQGLKLWLIEDLSVSLTANTYQYTFGPSGTVVMTKPLRVIDAYYMDSNNNKRPLNPIAWEDWVVLPNPTLSPGAIVSYFIDKQQLQLNVNFWPAPDSTAATGTAHLIIEQQVTNYTTASSTTNFPIEWFMALRWALAEELSIGQPQDIVAKCQERSMFYRTALENWDVEDAPTRFAPSQQYQSAHAGSFR
ncbi:MAG: hypothetical protein KGI11_09590, partial [Thaumarchaeota archaeon]|nr:hypothetical protein [Nitrososphaerota archaeon]